MTLYAFPTRDERDTFEALIATTGVGPKLALAMLSVHSPSGAAARGARRRPSRARRSCPASGPAPRQRLLIELKARLAVPDLDLTEGDAAPSARAEVRGRAGRARLRPRRGARRARCDRRCRRRHGRGAPARSAQVAGGGAASEGRAAARGGRPGRGGRGDQPPAAPPRRVRGPAAAEGAPRDPARRRRGRGQSADHLLFAGPPGWARPRCRASSPPSSRSACASRAAPRSSAPVTSPRSSPTSTTATCCSSTRSTACPGRWRRSSIPRWRTSSSTS